MNKITEDELNELIAILENTPTQLNRPGVQVRLESALKELARHRKNEKQRQLRRIEKHESLKAKAKRTMDDLFSK